MGRELTVPVLAISCTATSSSRTRAARARPTTLLGCAADRVRFFIAGLLSTHALGCMCEGVSLVDMDPRSAAYRLRPGMRSAPSRSIGVRLLQALGERGRNARRSRRRSEEDARLDEGVDLEAAGADSDGLRGRWSSCVSCTVRARTGWPAPKLRRSGSPRRPRPRRDRARQCPGLLLWLPQRPRHFGDGCGRQSAQTTIFLSLAVPSPDSTVRWLARRCTSASHAGHPRAVSPRTTNDGGAPPPTAHATRVGAGVPSAVCRRAISARKRGASSPRLGWPYQRHAPYSMTSPPRAHDQQYHPSHGSS